MRSREEFWSGFVACFGCVFIIGLCVFSLMARITHATEPPQPSLNIPCKVIDVVDVDTVTIEITIKARVRLLDCWAPEIRTRDKKEKADGIRSRNNLRKITDKRDALLVVPIGYGNNRLDSVFTFGRILGHIHIQGISIAEQQVKGGFATKLKQKRLDP